MSQPSGFGALMQSIAAARYLGRRIRYRGLLLNGGGALDLARPEFEEAPGTVPVTVTAGQRAALPDEPQALDF